MRTSFGTNFRTFMLRKSVGGQCRESIEGKGKVDAEKMLSNNGNFGGIHFPTMKPLDTKNGED